jgi:aryl-alcohol dehydrogenase-like predicted oxidoreductase
VPIPGTRRPERLKENTEAASVSLTPDQLAQLDTATSVVHGARGTGQETYS